MVETFTNEFGEQWWYIHDRIHNIGILTGNDDLIMGQIFYAVDGMCGQLILNQAEKNWLKECWDKYSTQTSKSIYID